MSEHKENDGVEEENTTDAPDDNQTPTADASNATNSPGTDTVAPQEASPTADAVPADTPIEASEPASNTADTSIEETATAEAPSPDDSATAAEETTTAAVDQTAAPAATPDAEEPTATIDELSENAASEAEDSAALPEEPLPEEAAEDPAIDMDALPDLPLDPEPEVAEPEDTVTEEPTAETHRDVAPAGTAHTDMASPTEDVDAETSADPTEDSEEEDELSAEIKAALEATAVEDDASDPNDETPEEDAASGDEDAKEATDNPAQGGLNPRIPIGIGALGIILGVIGLQMSTRASKQAEQLQLQFDAFRKTVITLREENKQSNATIAKLEQQLQAVDEQIQENIAPLHSEMSKLHKFDASAQSKLNWNTETIQLINLTIGKLFDEKVERNRSLFKDELVAILQNQAIDLKAIAHTPPPPIQVNETSDTLPHKEGTDAHAPAVHSPASLAEEQPADAAAHNDDDTSFAIATHSIEIGDTLSSIAKQYDVPLAALFAANPDVDPRDLKIGEVIYLPLQAER